jgi:ABC-2 type transport system permease protein
VLLLTWASLGLGFLISAVSRSESQAVQLSMIALLGSVFFSGFFLPLENFIPYVRGVAYVLPVTHGVQAFQDIMLRGNLPSNETIAWLSGIALVCFVLAWQLWRRNLKRR